jgi:hypothetical protein
MELISVAGPRGKKCEECNFLLYAKSRAYSIRVRFYANTALPQVPGPAYIKKFTQHAAAFVAIILPEDFQ